MFDYMIGSMQFNTISMWDPLLETGFQTTFYRRECQIDGFRILMTLGKIFRIYKMISQIKIFNLFFGGSEAILERNVTD